MTSSQNSTVAKPQNILPKKTKLALIKMTELTQATIEAFESETNAITMKTDVELLSIMKNKQDVNDLYQQAATEFMERQAEFMAHSSRAMQELTELQKQLSTTIKLNMSILEKVTRASDGAHRAK
jgi:hypothetical protein